MRTDLLRRLWPQRLTGQMIGLLLAALVIAQAANFVIFMDERRAAIRSVERTQILERTASLIRLIESSPSSLHGQMVHAASSRKLYFWLADASPISDGASHGSGELRQRLQDLLGGDESYELRVKIRNQREGVKAGEGGRAPSVISGVEVDDPGVVISAHLRDGRWLNAGMGIHPPLSRWALPTLISMALAGGSICLIVVLMVQRITRPLARLAEAAERVGRGETVGPISEEGPVDIRQTIRAFNRMYDRLQRFVQDRTRMLAAISHDLRTPITALRLRAELVEDEDTRSKMLGTLDEMQRITEATLAFARDEAATETSRTVDLAALIDSLCEDLADLGMDVRCHGADRTPYACRPVSLRRAIRNLVENAVAYGGRARVALDRCAEEFRITIRDDGPGIPEQDFERVFQPFVRLEASRSQATGGIGLGMAIARSIVRKHGGDISLAACPGGGFSATIHLPVFESPIPDPDVVSPGPVS